MQLVNFAAHFCGSRCAGAVCFEEEVLSWCSSVLEVRGVPGDEVNL